MQYCFYCPLLDTGAEADTINGGDGSDVIFAGYNDTVDGGTNGPFGTGDSLLISFLGATVGVTADFRQSVVANGTGTISGIENVNWVQGSNFDDDITLGSGNGYSAFTPVFGMGGNDRLIAGYYTGVLDGGDGDDYLDGRGSQYLQSIAGGAGNDTIYSGALTSGTISGGDGNDIIYATGNINGDAGDDQIFIQSGGFAGLYSVRGGAGNDIIVAAQTVGATILGDEGADTLTGGDAADTITGGAGNDSINGGAQLYGGDLFPGSTPNDIAVYSGIPSDYAFTRNPNTGVVTVVDLRPGSPDGTDTLRDIEVIRFSNSSYSIEAVLTGQASGVINFTGTAADDSFVGSEDANTVTGNGGNDTLYGYGGSDDISGNAGRDTIFGGDGNDTLYSGDRSGGFGPPQTGNPAPTLDTGVEVDTLNGGAGDDRLFAGYGDNVDGGAGSDTLYLSLRGATAGVTADFRQATVTIGGGTLTNIENFGWLEGSDFDDVITLSPNFTGSFISGPIIGGGGNDQLTAGYYTESLYGGVGNDFLDGRSSQYLNRIEGGDGDDTIYGALNSFAALFGGAGSDTIYISSGSANGGAGNDTIIVNATGFSTSPISGDEGDDILTAGRGAVSFAGGDGADQLTGSISDDLLISGNFQAGSFNTPADDLGLERDTILAGDGIDRVYIGVGDSADGGTGSDTLFFSFGGATAGVTVSTASLINGSYNNAGGYIVNFEILGSVRGSEFADVITTGTQAARLTVNAGGGNDTVIVGASAITANGGEGADRFVAGAAGSLFDGGNGVDIVDYGNAAAGITVTLQGASFATVNNGDQIANIEQVIGTAFADGIVGDFLNNSLFGGGGNDVIDGNSGDDLLDGGEGNDSLFGGPGNDVLRGGSGADQLNGSSGTDTASYAGDFGAVWVDLTTAQARWNAAEGDTLISIENLTGTEFGDRLIGSAVGNVLVGGGGDDLLSGLAGNDSLQGGDGNDTLLGGTGADAIDGGNGVDLVDFTGEFGAVRVDLASGRGNWNAAEGDTYAGIENVTGTSFGDTLLGNAADNVLAGGDGDDTLMGRGGADTLNGGLGTDTATYAEETAAISVNLATGIVGGAAAGDVLISIESVIGTNFGDTLIGTADNNSLAGGGGDDLIAAGGGADIVDGGTGTDTVDFTGEFGAVFVNLLSGSGRWNAAEGDSYAGLENVTGTSFGDRLIGSDAANILRGGDGDDTLTGAGGADTLDGGTGVDTADYYYSGASGGVTVDLQAGTGSGGAAAGDILIGIENLLGTDFADTLWGDAGANALTGNGGSDTLFGRGGNDVIDGGAGDDVIAGGIGADTLIGGTGVDTLSYAGEFGAVWIDLQAGVARWNAAEGDTISGFENVTGTNFGDRLIGDAGTNVLNGGDGDDSLRGGAGADVIDGGAGIDTADYSGEFGGVWIDLAAGIGRWNAAEGDTLTGIERVIGTSFGDRIEGNGGANIFTGGAGADEFIFRAGFGQDRITDFAIGTDTVRFASGLFANFADILARAVQSGSDVVITLDASNTLTLSDVQLANLTANDFVIG